MQSWPHSDDPPLFIVFQREMGDLGEIELGGSTTLEHLEHISASGFEVRSWIVRARNEYLRNNIKFFNKSSWSQYCY